MFYTCSVHVLISVTSQTTHEKFNAKLVKITNKVYKFIIKLTINKLVIIKFYFKVSYIYIIENVSLAEY